MRTGPGISLATSHALYLLWYSSRQSRWERTDHFLRVVSVPLEQVSPVQPSAPVRGPLGSERKMRRQRTAIHNYMAPNFPWANLCQVLFVVRLGEREYVHYVAAADGEEVDRKTRVCHIPRIEAVSICLVFFEMGEEGVMCVSSGRPVEKAWSKRVIGESGCWCFSDVNSSWCA